MSQLYIGRAPSRMGLMHPSIAPYGAYECADGKAIVIGIQNEREWVRFCAAVMGDAGLATNPRFCDNPRRIAHRAELEALICAAFGREPRDALGRRLKAAEIAFGNLNEVEDLVRHPQLRVGDCRTPGDASVTLPLPPALATGAPLGAVPRKDEHGAAIRREFA
jgi:crotonobetainyl-CoA:carnitine CoA-transferase CaiB-like acyl-CoA transferase